MPENGDENIPVKTTLNKPQVDFIDRAIVDPGYAMNRADALRYLVVRAMEQNES